MRKIIAITFLLSYICLAKIVAQTIEVDTIYNNGDKYVGQWKNGQRNGFGTMTYSNGDKYVGQWKNGQRNGFGTMTYSNGDKYGGDWKNGQRNGQVGLIIYADGRKYIGEWKEDQKGKEGLNLGKEISVNPHEALDGTVLFVTQDDSKAYNNCGVIMHNRQIIPNEYFGSEDIGEFEGIHYFRTGKWVGSDTYYPEALFDCKGNEIVPYQKGYTHFDRIGSDKDFFLIRFKKDEKCGIMDGKNGNILLKPQYDYIYSYRNGELEIEQDRVRKQIAFNPSKISSESSSNSEKSDTSNRHWHEISDDFFSTNKTYYIKDKQKILEKIETYNDNNHIVKVEGKKIIFEDLPTFNIEGKKEVPIKARNGSIYNVTQYTTNIHGFTIRVLQSEEEIKLIIYVINVFEGHSSPIFLYTLKP